jgi:hypothetical protein
MKILIALVVFAVLALVGVGCSSYAKTDSVTVFVKDKESVNTSDGHEYRVYTDVGTFVMKDSFIHPRFDTADEYATLYEGQRYDCEKFGWRIPLFSAFENLINCKPAQE